MYKCYIISYDVSSGEDDDLIKCIRGYGTWANITESTWAVVTQDSHVQVRDRLLQFLTEDDRLFVIRSSGIASWQNVICHSEWLKKNLQP